MNSRWNRAAAPLALAACVALAAPAAAEFKTPRTSPKSEVSQEVGLAKVTVVYSRPGVKGRSVWGGLVPYDAVWRTGANEATAITFTEDVAIEGQPLPKGTYALHTIPGKDEWTVIINKKADIWGSYAYEQKDDALRVKVKPKAIEHVERLTIGFPEVKADGATLAIDWEKVRVPVQITVPGTVDKVLADARVALKTPKADDWQTPWSAADFAFQNKVAKDDMWTWIDASIKAKAHWVNLRGKAYMLAAEGKYKEAVTFAEKSLAADKDAPAAEQAVTKRMIAEWSAK